MDSSKTDPSRGNAAPGGKAGVLASLIAALSLSIGLIKPWESPGGQPNLQPYLDIVGIATDCYGNTHGVRMDRVRTVAECDAMIDAEVRAVAVILAQCITHELAPHEAAAVLSWAYNVGTRAACSSTLVRQVNRGEPAMTWCAQLERWTHAGGKFVQGLANRRKTERALCEGHLP